MSIGRKRGLHPFRLGLLYVYWRDPSLPHSTSTGRPNSVYMLRNLHLPSANPLAKLRLSPDKSGNRVRRERWWSTGSKITVRELG